MNWNKLSKSSGVSWGKTTAPSYPQQYKNFNILQEDGSKIFQQDGKSSVQFQTLSALWNKIMQSVGAIWRKEG